MSSSSMTTTVSEEDILLFVEKNDVSPPFLRYDGQDSYFGRLPPLSIEIGYGVVLGFGVIFSIVTTVNVFLGNRFGSSINVVKSEFFK